MKLEKAEFRNINIGNVFLVYEKGNNACGFSSGYMSTWIKLDNLTGLCCGETRSFTLYDNVYYDLDKYFEELIKEI